MINITHQIQIMSKWSKFYGFGSIPPLPPNNTIIICANKLFGIDVNINSNNKLITSYDHIIRRLFSGAMKAHDYEKIKLYLENNAPVHFGKSLCVNFIGDTCPIDILNLLIDKTNINSPSIIPLIYHCMENKYVNESVQLIDKMIGGNLKSYIAYVCDAYEDFLSEIIKHMISNSMYNSIEKIGSEILNNSIKKYNRFFKILAFVYEKIDWNLKNETLSILLIKLSIYGQYQYTNTLLNSYEYPQNILDNLLETCAHMTCEILKKPTSNKLSSSAMVHTIQMSDVDGAMVHTIQMSDVDDFLKCVSTLLTKGANYVQPNLSKINNPYAFGIIGANRFRSKYDTSGLANLILNSDRITDYYGLTIDLETFLKFLHTLFFSTLELNMYPIMCANWSEIIYFLLNECDTDLKFKYQSYKSYKSENILELVCRNNYWKIVDLILNNKRIHTNVNLSENNVHKAIQTTCEYNRIESMKILLNNERSNKIIISKSIELARLTYDQKKLEMLDCLVSNRNYKLVPMLYQTNDSGFNDVLFKKIVHRLWQIYNTGYTEYLIPDILNIICQMTLWIL